MKGVDFFFFLLDLRGEPFWERKYIYSKKEKEEEAYIYIYILSSFSLTLYSSLSLSLCVLLIYRAAGKCLRHSPLIVQPISALSFLFTIPCPGHFRIPPVWNHLLCPPFIPINGWTTYMYLLTDSDHRLDHNQRSSIPLWR